MCLELHNIITLSHDDVIKITHLKCLTGSLDGAGPSDCLSANAPKLLDQSEDRKWKQWVDETYDEFVYAKLKIVVSYENGQNCAHQSSRKRESIGWGFELG